MKSKKVLKSLKSLSVYLIAALFGLSTAVYAASTPVPANGTEIESDTAVANVTDGDTQYYTTVDATVNDVVKVQVYYHNMEASDSGKVGNNVNVKVTLPTASETNHTITSVVGGTNTNVITNSTYVTTSVGTTLQYIPGSAYRRYNAGTNANPNIVTVNISDSVVTGSGYTIPTLNPCWNFDETITVEARVMAPVVTIVKKVRIDDTGSYVTNLEAEEGATLDYAFEIKNAGNTTLTNVIIRDVMPVGVTFVPGSVSLRSALYPNGHAVSDDLFTGGGLNVGAFTPGSNAIISFEAVVSDNLSAGTHTFINYAYVRADGIQYERYNTAWVIVKVEAEENEPTCALSASPTTIVKGNSSTLTFSSTNATSGTLTSFGEVGTSGTRTVKPTTDTTYTYVVTGPGGTATCTATVRVTTSENPNEELPTSGPLEAAAGAVGLTATGGAGYALLRSKKALLSSLKKIK